MYTAGVLVTRLLLHTDNVFNIALCRPQPDSEICEHLAIHPYIENNCDIRTTVHHTQTITNIDQNAVVIQS